ncbi:unnamed protein product [Rotaria sordida]|uniref:Uncharacterized protein n=1 Tax=Rotaria sordida TaxID=392033 RepID=A0A813YCJ6_9BILA|nr:unnamed protein product [Rotaria sordida]CAF0882225.1 unnamed protein product [Rotaria sordida]CAF3756003.1 unnamed protein product [Rotaria sordida]CAF3921707.1 unnamed protein product [Rotaria sordida]
MFNGRFFSCIILLSFVLSSLASIEPLCKWYGRSPFCFFGNSCPKDCWHVTANDRGDGKKCWFGMKNYCCCAKKTIDSIINSFVNSK